MGRYHVIRQLPCQHRMQGFSVQFGRQRISHDLAVIVDLHMGIADAVERADALGNLTQRDPVAADLHLVVVAAVEAQASIFQHLYPVTGGIKPFARRPGIIHKGDGRLFRLPKVSPGKAGAAQVEFADGTLGQR